MTKAQHSLIRTSIVLTLMLFFLSCSNDGGTGSEGSGGHTYPMLFRIGLFTGMNGTTAGGQMEIYRNTTTLEESFETLNDFLVTGATGTIEFWLTDNSGATSLSSSSNKVLIGSLSSGYSGVHTFPIPTGQSSSAYTYVVVFSVSGNKNVGKAQLLLPLPPG